MTGWSRNQKIGAAVVAFLAFAALVGAIKGSNEKTKTVSVTETTTVQAPPLTTTVAARPRTRTITRIVTRTVTAPAPSAVSSSGSTGNTAAAAATVEGPGDTTHATDGAFCTTHMCIDNFVNGHGAIVRCADGEWSHSGGLSGACSRHGGEA